MENDIEQAERGFVTMQQNNASAEIRVKYRDFSENEVTNKYPDAVDGLKVSTRRILWSARDFHQMVGFSKVVGAVAELHVGGDNSIIEAIVRLGQPFKMGIALIDIDGNYGNYYAPSDHADSRYLKARISKFAWDVYFAKVDTATIPFTASKDFTTIEPLYLIPRLPMALIAGNLTIGVGYKSEVPMIGLSSACDAAITFVKEYTAAPNRYPHKSMAASLIPSFPITNLIKNRPELIKHYSVGEYDYPIEIEGWAELSGDTIVVRAVSFGEDFGKTCERIQDLFCNPNNPFADYLISANKYNAEEANLTLTLKRGRNPFEVLEKMAGQLRYNRSWRPLYRYVSENQLRYLTPAMMLDMWYSERYTSISNGLKYRHANLVRKQRETEAKLMVCENVDEVIAIIRGSSDADDAIYKLCRRFDKLSRFQARILYGMPIGELNKSSRGKLEKELEQIHADLNNTLADYERIPDIIVSDIQQLKKLYGYATPTKYADEFIGYVKYGDWGVTQFFDEGDLVELMLTKWPSSVTRTIHLYDRSRPRKLIMRKNGMVPLRDNSRHIWCSDLLCYPAGSHEEYTLAISAEGNTSVIEKMVAFTNKDFKLFPISRVFWAVHENGSITRESYQNFSIRKTVSTGAKTDLIYALPGNTKDVLVFHMNTEDPNRLRIDRILQKDDVGRLNLTAMGHTVILGVVPTDRDETYLNIPTSCRDKSSMEYLHVTGIKKCFSGADRTTLIKSLGRGKSSGKALKKHPQIRTMCELMLDK